MIPGFEVIKPFVAPIWHLIEDPEVTEVMRNSDGTIWIERNGLLEIQPGVQMSEHTALTAMQNTARLLLGDLSPSQPLLDASLPNGSRVSAALPPVSLGCITFNIRKFSSSHQHIATWLSRGSIHPKAVEVIQSAIEEDNANVLICGGTSTGKTSLLNALSPQLGDARVVVIEDTAELQLHQRHVVRLVAKPGITIRDLVRHAMRRRPDRIIVGEVRGAEAFDMLQAMNSGHGSSLATIHADDAHAALTKLARYAMQAGVPEHVASADVAEAIDMVVYLERQETGKRFVASIIDDIAYTPQDGFTFGWAYKWAGEEEKQQ